jgi:NAD+ diphosphatase
MQLLHWDKKTQYCGSCGAVTARSKIELAKHCDACKALYYPQISPVMLVLIWRENEILLARSPHFLPGTYSLLAGFVEVGETLEQTVVRETMEEVGLTIKNIRYCASQPWPFQSNLMLGFTAEYDSGAIKIDYKELEDAQWFSIDNLPGLPNTVSLSRQIIDVFLASKRFK